jgi:histidyl-tRNA synthetase
MSFTRLYFMLKSLSPPEKFPGELPHPMKNIIQSLKGTRDFYPEDMAIRNWLYRNIRSVSESFGYQEYEGPFLESIALYAAKSGEELVKEQSFVFPDRGGDLITLRPELTPTLARMVAQRQRALAFPLRWWSFGPFWRYERPQKGRTREFFQWNIDLIGVDTPDDLERVRALLAVIGNIEMHRPTLQRIPAPHHRIRAAELRLPGTGIDFRSLPGRDGRRRWQNDQRDL